MSRRRTLLSRQWVPQSVEQVWALFSNPANLDQLTPPWYGAHATLKGEFRDNCTVVISLKPFGVPAPLNWVSKILDLKVDKTRAEFVDLQVSGPFAYWRHHHVFEAGDKEFHGKRSGQTIKVDSGGTWIIDDVEYEMPYGLLGSLAEKIFARKQLEAMFAYRKTQVLRLLANPV